MVRRHIRSLLPRQAFSPNPWRLVPLAVHVASVGAGAAVIGATDNLAARVACALVIGHALLCIGFIAHDISHGSVLRHRGLRWLAETVAWAVSLTSATMWRVNHNVVHHRHTNTLADSFRYLADSEAVGARGLVALASVPNRRWKWSPLVFLTYLTQSSAHTTGALLHPSRHQTALVTRLGRYSGAQRLRILGDLALIAAIQVGVFHLAGGTWLGFAFATVAPAVIASALASAYLFTQHGLVPLSDIVTPLGSTSLRLPRAVDWLHSNHSHHTAHHLFEGLRSDVYPEITRLLAQHYPDDLHILGPVECWRQLWQNRSSKPDPTPAEEVVRA